MALLGFALARIPSRDAFFSREGFTVVGLIWLAFSLFGALPFWFSGEFQSFADCLFEIVSGLPPPAAPSWQTSRPCPRHPVLAVLRLLDRGHGRAALHAGLSAPCGAAGPRCWSTRRSPGPIFSKLVPKTVQSSQILYVMYFVLTGAEILAFLLAGLPLYDAVVTTFACVCTAASPS